MRSKKGKARYSREKRAKYGQNYIKNPALARRLLALCDFDRSMPCFEIGSGRGIFTKELIKHAKHIYSIDIDKENIDYLNDTLKEKVVTGKLVLFAEDALLFDLKFMCPLLKHGEYNLFGNIPYNISTKLVKRYLLKKPMPEKACLTVQKEFAKRLLGKRKEKHEGLLHILLDSFYEMKIIYEYKREDFSPTPSVDSVLMLFKLKSDVPQVVLQNFGGYKNILSAAYRQPIKSIERFLRDKIPASKIQKLADRYKFKLKDKCTKINAKQWMRIFQEIYK